MQQASDTTHMPVQTLGLSPDLAALLE